MNCEISLNENENLYRSAMKVAPLGLERDNVGAQCLECRRNLLSLGRRGCLIRIHFYPNSRDINL